MTSIFSLIFVIVLSPSQLDHQGGTAGKQPLLDRPFRLFLLEDFGNVGIDTESNLVAFNVVHEV
jgi:hypothetical protein